MGGDSFAPVLMTGVGFPSLLSKDSFRETGDGRLRAWLDERGANLRLDLLDQAAGMRLFLAAELFNPYSGGVSYGQETQNGRGPSQSV
jgi:hypothetical protein